MSAENLSQYCGTTMPLASGDYIAEASPFRPLHALALSLCAPPYRGLAFHSQLIRLASIDNSQYRMQEGSFFVLVQRQSTVSTWLPFKKFSSEASFTKRFVDLDLRAQKASTKQVNAGVSATPLSFSFPGAFGLALQETLEVAGGVSFRKQPSCFATKRAAIVFQGYLSNLDELIEELLYGSLPVPGTSYESEFNRASLQLHARGDQALLSAEVILHLFLRAKHDSYNLPILLSELQGQYAFVIYDSSKRQVFAARDSSGKEPLFAKHEEDNTLAFTNKPLQSWGTSDGEWQEVLPGHYLGGRNPKQVQQFALTPQQLHRREYVESLEDLSPSPQPAFLESLASPKRVSTASRDEDKALSSARSSSELDRHVDQLFRISV